MRTICALFSAMICVLKPNDKYEQCKLVYLKLRSATEEYRISIKSVFFRISNDFQAFRKLMFYSYSEWNRVKTVLVD